MSSFPASYRKGRVGYRATSLFWTDPYGEVMDRLKIGNDTPPVNEVPWRTTEERERDRNKSLDAWTQRHIFKRKKQAAIAELEQKAIREAALEAIRAANRRALQKLALKLARRLNPLGTILDIIDAIDAISDLLGDRSSQDEPLAQRAQVSWPGKAGWSLHLDCSPAAGILSPFHYPQLLGSSCLSLWNNFVSERGFYTIQTTGGVTYRTFRLMEQATLDHPANPPGLPAPYDIGSTYQQWKMVESVFQTNPNYYRRQVLSSAASMHTYAPTARARLQQINPNLLSPLTPEPTPQPLPWPMQPHRPRPRTDEASGSSYGVKPRPRPGTGTGTGTPNPSPGAGGGVTNPPGTAIAFDGTGRAHRYRTRPHQRRPAGKNEKEAKAWGRAAKLLNHVLNGITEYADFVDAAKSALAKNGIYVKGYDPLDVLGALWENWDAGLAADFVVALVINEVGDRIFGRAMAARAKAARTNPFDGSTRIHGEGLRGGPVNAAAFDLGATFR